MTIDDYVNSEERVRELWDFAWKNGYEAGKREQKFLQVSDSETYHMAYEKGYDKGRASGVDDGIQWAVDALMDNLDKTAVCEWMRENSDEINDFCDPYCDFREPPMECIRCYVERKING